MDHLQDKELLAIWSTYDQKLDQVLSLNKEIVRNMTTEKVSRTIRRLRLPKLAMVVIGIPYTLVLYTITFLAFLGGAPFVMIGFGAISLIMTVILIIYGYHLYLIYQINCAQEIVDVQQKIAKLRLSTYGLARWTVVQLPFWSVCWMSLDAHKASPFLYGGINLMVFLALCYLAYLLYSRLDIRHSDSRVRRFFLSGSEWEPIIKASNILEELKEY